MGSVLFLFLYGLINQNGKIWTNMLAINKMKPGVATALRLLETLSKRLAAWTGLQWRVFSGFEKLIKRISKVRMPHQNTQGTTQMWTGKGPWISQIHTKDTEQSNFYISNKLNGLPPSKLGQGDWVFHTCLGLFYWDAEALCLPIITNPLKKPCTPCSKGYKWL